MKLLLLGLALAALPDTLWAGYSTTGDSLVSGQETIIGTATIKGNAFSVGGSTFTVLAGTVNVGGLLRVGAAGIQWNDNSVSVTAGGAGSAVLTATQTFSGANTFTGTVRISTWAAVNVSGASTASTFQQCIATTTINVAGSTVTVWGSGAGDPTQNCEMQLFVLMDGAYLGSQSKTKGMIAVQSFNASNGGNLSFNRVFTGVSSGQHDFCIGGAITGGTLTLPSGWTDVYQFGVREDALK